ncbi:MAG: 60S ribosomal protein L13 [Vezdaea aestivalis]|nr:MAG: 60S ribosomal protein L13 [Vezdaea aestivalis]
MPGRKQRRRKARLAKVAASAPRPADKLRPIVRCPTIKYNRRVRAGRGFSLEELKVCGFSSNIGMKLIKNCVKEAGISRRVAPTIGISVDPRRQNISVESLAVNVARLKAYQARLIVFPRKAGKQKTGDASASDIKALRNGQTVSSIGGTLPISNKFTVKEIKKSELPKGEEAAYRKLRIARSDARLVGVREKRNKSKADEAAASKK